MAYLELMEDTKRNSYHFSRIFRSAKACHARGEWLLSPDACACPQSRALHQGHRVRSGRADASPPLRDSAHGAWSAHSALIPHGALARGHSALIPFAMTRHDAP